MRNFTEAAKYILRALKIHEQLDNDLGVYLGYSNLGLLYEEQGDLGCGLQCMIGFSPYH
jgi:hypothetical protein